MLLLNRAAAALSAEAGEESAAAMRLVVDAMQAIASSLMQPGNLRVSLNAENAEMLSDAQRSLDEAMGAALAEQSEDAATRHEGAQQRCLREAEEAFAPSLAAGTDKTYFPLPIQVHYNAHCVHTKVSLQDEHYAPLRLLGIVMQHAYLHKEVREKGGAYGSGPSIPKLAPWSASYHP